jgi:hypothetical protein
MMPERMFKPSATSEGERGRSLQGATGEQEPQRRDRAHAKGGLVVDAGAGGDEVIE